MLKGGSKYTFKRITSKMICGRNRVKKVHPAKCCTSSQEEEGPVSLSSAQSEPTGRRWMESVVPRFKESVDLRARQRPVNCRVRLNPYLKGKAQATYKAITAEEMFDYRKVKRLFLQNNSV